MRGEQEKSTYYLISISTTMGEEGTPFCEYYPIEASNPEEAIDYYIETVKEECNQEMLGFEIDDRGITITGDEEYWRLDYEYIINRETGERLNTKWR